ncbi:MAG: adaptor protein MecA [Lachnospiraceae bacterium]|nr:adaptor protein MecA [Lachnospiraceae bacterium]
MILTFSDRDPEIKESDQFIECLKEMKRILQRTREKIGGGNADASGNGDAQSAGQDQNGAADANGTDAKGARQVSRPTFAVFAFAELGRIIEFASMLPANLQVESSVHVMDGLYFLYLLKGRASYERYSRACIQALEFASLYAAEPSQTAQLEEHGECLIAEKALKKLRK